MTEERYDFTWHGKKKAAQLANTLPLGTLKPCKQESVNWDTTDNLFIEGDNLEVLKLIQKDYANKIKMIYIDPPYNTGKDLVYNDKFKYSLYDYLKLTGQKMPSNPEVAGRHHTRWLNMMYPRLKLARNFLSNDGVIFISIDDHEVANLRKMCDEIFGEDNFVAQLVWEKKKKGAFLSSAVTTVKEYLLVFAKASRSFPGLIGEIARNKETYPVIKTTNARSERIIKKGISSNFKDKNYHASAGSRISSGNMEMILLSDLTIKNGILAENVKVDSNWIYSQKLLDKYAEEKTLYITQDLYFRRIVSEPRIKTLKDILPMRGSNEVGLDFKLSDNLFVDGWGTNEDGFDEVHKLLGAQSLMSFPKPSKLIAKLCLATTRFDKNSTILDFFAGSCTTAHAVMKLNAEDGGNRKFIMVQLPELTNKKSEAFKAGYKNIADIGKERIRRVINKLKDEHPNNTSIDLGFKVFKVGATVKGEAVNDK